MLRKSFFFILLYSLGLYAQVGGEKGYQFLNIVSSARITALGGKVATLLNDVNQPNFNPSVINSKMAHKISVNYSSFLADISVASVSYAHKFGNKSNILHSSIKYINYGKFIEANEDGEETGTFSAYDFVLSFGTAHKILNTNFYAGANLKYAGSVIQNYSSSIITTDFAVSYYTDYKPYVLTLTIRNLGFVISKYNKEKDKIPLDIALGGSYRLENVPIKVYASIDNLQQWNISVANPSKAKTDLEGNVTPEKISFLNNALRHFSFGAEFFPERAINLRIGYNVRRNQELQLQNVRTFGGLSFGFGLKIRRMKINYAYSKYHSASNTGTFSLEIDLAKKKKR